MKLSKLRESILKTVNEAEKPLNAKSILDKIDEEPNFSSVYRGLEFLEKNNLISSVSFSGVRFYFSSKNRNGHFIFCKNCQEVIQFDKCGVSSLEERLAEKYKFTIESHILYFEGYCDVCKKAIDKKKSNKN